jgi:hypothetical protein
VGETGWKGRMVDGDNEGDSNTKDPGVIKVKAVLSSRNICSHDDKLMPSYS